MSFSASSIPTASFSGLWRTCRRNAMAMAASVTVGVGALEITTHLPSQGRSSLFFHRVVDDYITPWMRRWLDPEVAHHVALVCAKLGLSPHHHPSVLEQRVSVQSTIWGRTFPNPIGLGAGFDKDGEVIEPMFALGFGFVEIGTVTPQPQPGNPKPRMFRLPEDLAIINRYGFNSTGAEQVGNNLRRFRHRHRMLQDHQQGSRSPVGGVVGVNIGKNKDTIEESAIREDYVSAIRSLGPMADYLVLNLSSPNTAGLRDWQHADRLRGLVSECQRARNDVAPTIPILIKVAPDLTTDELRHIAQICLECRVEGIIVTNTTNQRPDDLLSYHRHEVGGLSGRPLRDCSTECIRALYGMTGGTIPLIGVGGIGSGRDAYEKLRAGASLVQVYSMMIYAGPGLVSRIRAELAEVMIEHKHECLEDVIGLDHPVIYYQRRKERLAF